MCWEWMGGGCGTAPCTVGNLRLLIKCSAELVSDTGKIQAMGWLAWANHAKKDKEQKNASGWRDKIKNVRVRPVRETASHTLSSSSGATTRLSGAKGEQIWATARWSAAPGWPLPLEVVALCAGAGCPSSWSRPGANNSAKATLKQYLKTLWHANNHISRASPVPLSLRTGTTWRRHRISIRLYISRFFIQSSLSVEFGPDPSRLSRPLPLLCERRILPLNKPSADEVSEQKHKVNNNRGELWVGAGADLKLRNLKHDSLRLQLMASALNKGHYLGLTSAVSRCNFLCGWLSKIKEAMLAWYQSSIESWERGGGVKDC